MIYRLLRRQDNLAARLVRGIEWLDLAWKNTSSITPEVRIVAIRSGFEVLVSKRANDKLFVLAESLSALLDQAGATKQVRHWTKTLVDARAQDPCTDLEWWFVEFSLLRNDIAHGNTIVPARYLFNGEHHVMLGERTLRRAIKELVLPHGPKSLRLGPSDRELNRAVRAAVRAAMSTHKRQERPKASS